MVVVFLPPYMVVCTGELEGTDVMRRTLEVGVLGTGPVIILDCKHCRLSYYYT